MSVTRCGLALTGRILRLTLTWKFCQVACRSPNCAPKQLWHFPAVRTRDVVHSACHVPLAARPSARGGRRLPAAARAARAARAGLPAQAGAARVCRAARRRRGVAPGPPRPLRGRAHGCAAPPPHPRLAPEAQLVERRRRRDRRHHGRDDAHPAGHVVRDDRGPQPDRRPVLLRAAARVRGDGHLALRLRRARRPRLHDSLRYDCDAGARAPPQNAADAARAARDVSEPTRVCVAHTHTPRRS
eukprot:4276930-Prymnesium_polylepis.1